MDLRNVLLPVFVIVFVSATAAQPQFLSPIDQTSGDFQDDFGSASDSGYVFRFFKADLDNVNSDGTLTLYRKNADQKSFSEYDSIEVDSSYDSQYQQYYLRYDEEFQLDQGESNTFTAGGNEQTVELNGVETNGDAVLTINGIGPDSYAKGSFFEVGGVEVKVWDTAQGGESFPSFADFKVASRNSMPEGESSWRLEFDGEYSEQIYTSVNDADETPYLEETTINGTTVNDFDRIQVPRMSTVVGNIVESQGDNYNISLYNDDNGELVAYAGDTESLTLVKAKGLYGDILDALNIDTSSEDEYSFPTTGSDLLFNTASNYNYYFEIEDLGDNSQRTTPVYQVETSGDNYAPLITGVEGFDGSAWKSLDEFDQYGESLSKVRVSVDDLNNNLHTVQLSLKDLYDNNTRLNASSNYSVESGGVYVYDLNQSINASGDWTASVNVSDGDKHDYQELNWSIPFGSLTPTGFTVDNSTGATSLNESGQYQAQADFECVEGECASESSEILSASFGSSVSTVSGCSSTPFCTDDANPVEWNGSVQPGDSFSVSWMFGVTGDGGSSYELFTDLNSSNPNVPGNSSSSVEVSIVSSNTAPSADFSFSPSDPTTGESITFDGGGSSDSDGSVQQYKWDFDGDGAYDDLGESVTHSYGGTGDYDVRLQVLDDDGAVDETVRTVSVSESSTGGGSSGGGDTGDGDGDDSTDDDDDSGDTSEGSGGEVVTIIREVNNSEYSWTVGAAGSTGSQFFEPIGYPGREITREIEVENTGSRPVPLSFECVASGRACSWFELSSASMNLSAGETRTVQVSGSLPSDISPDQVYGFEVLVSDPTYSGGSDGVATVDFSIAVDPGLGRLLVVLNKVTQSRDVAGTSVPYGVLGLLAMIGFWMIATLLETVAGVKDHPLIPIAKLSTAFLVFWIAIALL